MLTCPPEASPLSSHRSESQAAIVHCVKRVSNLTSCVAQERRESWAASGVPGDDLLGVLLQAEDEEGRRLTDEELWEDVHDIMGAGHETTASTTIAALYCISQTPGVEEKVRRHTSPPKVGPSEGVAGHNLDT
jgi:cytochrome P450